MAEYKGNWAVEGMKRRRLELVAELKAQRQTIKDIQADIDVLDRALKVCGYRGNPKELSGKRVYRQMFKRGELQRLIFGYLRESALTEQEISERVLEAKGWQADATISSQVQRRVRYTLTRMRNDSQIKNGFSQQGEVWEGLSW
jgi:type II secretory pathway predicted ATPase ExeA